MGGMKDEAKRITIPPLFPRVHVNDTGRGGLSQPFDGKIYKRSTLPSPTNKNICDSTSSLSLSLPPPPNNPRLTSVSEKNQCKQTQIHKQTNIAKPKYHSKYLPSLDSRKFTEAVRVSKTDPQANTNLSLQFCNSSISKLPREAASKNLPFKEIILEDHANQNVSLDAVNIQSFAGSNNETQKKPKIVPDVSDSSALSGRSASSNDVARVIGDKRFWKMRTYMINQQKIFTGQVFELHRLIMVQKMVTKSPNLLLESKLNGTTRSSKVKKPNTEEYPEHMKPKLPLPSISKEFVTPIWSQQLLAPPGNQWLVPVISPSEGLVYKPYAGPCPPPPSAFMVPLYGGQDSLDTAFRFPVSTQFSHTYFPPRTTLFDQTNQFQRWSSASSHVTHTQAIPFSLKKSQESNDSEVHGSTASSPPEKHKFEVLPLFPTEPTHQTDQRAIKSIPHNPTSASESAARIFRCIQEERRESDHMIS